MTGKHGLKINKEHCKGCLLCLGVCPQKALELSKDVNRRGNQYVILKAIDKCTGCGLCFMMCPDCVIEITPVEEDHK